MTTHGNHSGITVIGEGLVGLLADSELAEATAYRQVALGDGLVTAVTAARMGIETSFVTRVGSDPYTEWLLTTWDKEELHLDHVRRGSGSNATVMVSSAGEFIPYRNASTAASLSEADVAHLPWPMSIFGYTTGSLQSVSVETRAAVLAAFKDARSQGVQTVYNPTLRPNRWNDNNIRQVRDAFGEILPHVDILIIKAPYSCGQLLDEASAEEAACAAQSLGVSKVVVRDPSGGCVVATERGTHVLSGDLQGLHSAMDGAFDGILMAAMARGFSIEGAAQRALTLIGETLLYQHANDVGLSGLPDTWSSDDC